MTYAPRLPAYAHQTECLERMRGKTAFALMQQMRTGKSKSICDDFGEMASTGGAQDLLIIAPAGSYRNWTMDRDGGRESELRRQLDPALFAQCQVATWMSGNAKAQRAVADLLAVRDRPRVLNINIEALSSVKKAREAVLQFLGAKRGAMVVVDECFPEGTKIQTPYGLSKIEDLRPGGLVLGSTGISRIKRLISKKSQVLVHLKLSNGIICRLTPNHPIFTDKGWICAGNSEGRYVFGKKELSNLWEDIYSDQEEIQILRKILRVEMDIQSTRNSSQSIYERTGEENKCSIKGETTQDGGLEQRYPAYRNYEEQNTENPQDQWSYVRLPVSIWSENDQGSASIIEDIRPALGSRTHHNIGKEAAKLSALLQSRHCFLTQEIGDRMRWIEPRQLGCTGTRQKTGFGISEIRVESVEIEKYQNPIDVYDLELEGTPHFFAEGILVHNSTTIRNPKASRSEFVWGLRKMSQYRRILTGLVAPRSPLDLYGQFFFLDPRILGHFSYYTFRARYAIMREMPVGEWFQDPRTHQPTRRTVKIPVAYRHQEELAAAIAPHSYRKLLADCYDVPETFYMMREVELTDEQARIYREIKENACAELTGGSWVSATEAMSQILRLHQVLCGHVGDEEQNLHLIPNKRVDAVLEVLAEHDGKAIVWSHYVPLLLVIHERLNKEYGEGSAALFYGGNRDTRHIDESRFLQDPACRFMCATQGAGGRGNTWDNADLAVYASNSFDLEHRDQSEWRTLNVGKRRNVTNVDLVVPGTIDEKVINALRAKIDVAAAIMGDGPRAWIV